MRYGKMLPFFRLERILCTVCRVKAVRLIPATLELHLRMLRKPRSVAVVRVLKTCYDMSAEIENVAVAADSLVTSIIPAEILDLETDFKKGQVIDNKLLLLTDKNQFLFIDLDEAIK